MVKVPYFGSECVWRGSCRVGMTIDYIKSLQREEIFSALNLEYNINF